MQMKKSLLVVIGLLTIVTSYCQIRLPKLVSDGMVLQRNAKVRIWGWAAAGEKVSVEFIGKTFSTVTAGDGSWSIMLPDLKPGGPYDMKISGSNTITLHDVLIGDVWVCSGQSNMEMSMNAPHQAQSTHQAHRTGDDRDETVI